MSITPAELGFPLHGIYSLYILYNNCMEIKIKGNTFLEDTKRLIEQKEAERIRLEEEQRRLEEERIRQEQEAERIRLEEEARMLASKPKYNPYDLTEKSNLNKEKAQRLLEGSALQTAAGAYVHAEEKHGVNAIFLMALTSHESGHGRSKLAINNNNIGGVKNSSGGWAYYSDWGECIMHIARFISNSYLKEDGIYYNGKSIWGVQKSYCPDGSAWADMINSLANEMLSRY